MVNSEFKNVLNNINYFIIKCCKIIIIQIYDESKIKN